MGCTKSYRKPDKVVDMSKRLYQAPLYKRIYLRIMWPIWRLKARVKHLLTGNCGMHCGRYAPYGFVPECGCPIHDE